MEPFVTRREHVPMGLATASLLSTVTKGSIEFMS